MPALSIKSTTNRAGHDPPYTFMAGMIPQSFIDDLLDRTDIVDVVDSRVKLKKSGKNYSACCPFHDEKTPSFTVSPDKQFFYCFGCGASGNALGFMMDYERLSYPEAIESLAHVAGLTVPREVQTEAQVQREQERKSIYSLLEKADDFYQHQLRQHPSKHLAVDYLKRRGLDGKTAKIYGVGYAPPGWDNLLKALAKTDEDKHLLIEGGMLIHHQDDNKVYDRFRHRIMFPIRDTRGRVIGFGGRVLGDDKPKYLNSPETPIFHKGQELYGLYEARLANQNLKRLLVVEGYMDVVSLAQFGITYSVATLGTACGEDHLTRAFKYTQEVVFCFDGDKAGRNAATRALEASLTTMADGRTVKFLFLPEGEDPDTLVRQVGTDKFERMIEMAVPLEDFLFDFAAEGLNIRTLEGRATFSKRAAPMLDKLPKSVFKELMFEQLATRTGLTRSVLQELIEVAERAPAQAVSPYKSVSPLPPTSPHKAEAPRPSTQGAQDFHSAPDYAEHFDNSTQHPDYSNQPDVPPADYEEYLKPSAKHLRTSSSAIHRPYAPPSAYLMPPAQKALALLLANPSLASTIPSQSEWLYVDDAQLQRLAQLIKLLQERPHYQLAHVIGYWRGIYGAVETEILASIAGNDLLQAAHAMSQVREDKPAKADYDAGSALMSCMDAISRQLSEKQSAESLAALKNIDLRLLSKEERDRLVLAALKKPSP